MRFEEWEPHYERILAYFCFEREGDERAARVLGSLLARDDLPLLENLCRNQEVTVCGNAPCLSGQLGLIRGHVFAADAAADVLVAHGIRPHAVFTDLDGADDFFLDINRKGTIMVIHAHGDNIPLLRSWVPRFEGPVVGTTQGPPLPNVHNFGGFTDGDRAVFAADEMGASAIHIIGFDLDDPSVDPVKRGKLHLARELLAILGYEC
ncbi:MAG: DUF115 domain-containing protein [Methanoregulaceae archaeon]|nr:DUF115 domain-containing protein [Methanoregulaceae archaeon]